MPMGDNARGLIAKARSLTAPTRALLSTDLKAPKFCEGPDINPNQFYTTGLYTLTYRRYTKTGTANRKRFCIQADFLYNGWIKFDSWRDLTMQAVSNEHVRFIMEFTNVSELLFDIAAQNEGMHIPLCIDLNKYDKLVRPQTGKAQKEYAMIYNSFKPYMECRWDLNELQDDIELIIKEERANENK